MFFSRKKKNQGTSDIELKARDLRLFLNSEDSYTELCPINDQTLLVATICRIFLLEKNEDGPIAKSILRPGPTQGIGASWFKPVTDDEDTSHRFANTFVPELMGEARSNIENQLETEDGPNIENQPATADGSGSEGRSRGRQGDETQYRGADVNLSGTKIELAKPSVRTSAWHLTLELRWPEISLARWDSEDEELIFNCWNLSRGDHGRLRFRPKESPTAAFMDLVREGITDTQVFSALVELPSGNRITVQILRDRDRNLWPEPAPDALKNRADQQYLKEILREWEEKLGLKVSGDTKSD